MTDLDLLLIAAKNVGAHVMHTQAAWRVVCGSVQLAAGSTPAECLRSLTRERASA